MSINFKDLPCVVEQNDQYRLVAHRKTKQAPSEHANHIVVDFANADEALDYDCVEVIAEFKRVDALGVESWSVSGIHDAVYSLLATRIRNSAKKITGCDHTKALPKKEKPYHE